MNDYYSLSLRIADLRRYNIALERQIHLAEVEVEKLNEIHMTETSKFRKDECQDWIKTYRISIQMKNELIKENNHTIQHLEAKMNNNSFPQKNDASIKI